MRATMRRASGLLLLGFLAACAGDPWQGYTPLPEAAQHPHPQSVPHTDRRGGLLTAYDPARSIFPVALGGALTDYGQTSGRGFHNAFLADFNAVAAEPDQPLTALLAAAEASRLQLLRPQRDLQHASLLDASAAVVIPLPRDPAESGDFAAALRQQAGKPVWALLPAYALSEQRQLGGAEARALAFAAIVNGASGIVWQGEDNYVARNAGMMGIAPLPQLDYGIRTGAPVPLAVTPDAVAASRRLWTAVAQLNRRIARIAPALLQPDADAPYEIAVHSTRMATAPPLVRGLLKPLDDAWLLIVVNPAPLPEEIRISMTFRKVARLEDDRPVDQDAARGLFRDRIPAYGAMLYRITP
jgi:hypothetical protein